MTCNFVRFIFILVSFYGFVGGFCKLGLAIGWEGEKIKTPRIFWVVPKIRGVGKCGVLFLFRYSMADLMELMMCCTSSSVTHGPLGRQSPCLKRASLTPLI